MHEFSGLEEIEQTLNGLTNHDGEPLVVRLPRQSGQKETRFAHLLSGEVAFDSVTEAVPVRRTVAPPSDRVANLEAEVAGLKEKFEELTQQFQEFKKQFE
jgi:uncharacterized protein YceH (UPF0502 family)